MAFCLSRAQLTAPLRSLVRSRPLSTTSVACNRTKTSLKLPKYPDKPHNVPKFSERWNFPKPEVPESDKYVPSKVLAVWLVKGVSGRTYEEKLILIKFGLNIRKSSDPIVLPNTPSVVELLWRVKHLVRVCPVTFPYGEPKEEDVPYSRLKPNGQLVVSRKLEVDPASVDMDVEHERVFLNTRYLGEYELQKYNNKWD